MMQLGVKIFMILNFKVEGVKCYVTLHFEINLNKFEKQILGEKLR